jgi:hypothetical protein
VAVESGGIFAEGWRELKICSRGLEVLHAVGYEHSRHSINGSTKSCIHGLTVTEQQSTGRQEYPTLHSGNYLYNANWLVHLEAEKDDEDHL